MEKEATLLHALQPYRVHQRLEMPDREQKQHTAAGISAVAHPHKLLPTRVRDATHRRQNFRPSTHRPAQPLLKLALKFGSTMPPPHNPQVYVPDADAAWARASVLNAVGGTVYEVRVDGIDDNDEAGQSDWGAGDVRRVDLAGAVHVQQYSTS